MLTASFSQRGSVCSSRQQGFSRCRSAPDQAIEQPQVALEGDLVYVHFDCRDESGELIETTRSDEGVPLTFEVGAGDLFANEMIKAMDAAVRGLAIGDQARVEAQGNEWKPELLFKVPRDHAEVQRLEGRYKNVGGLAAGLVVELANGSRAVVLDLSDDAVTLDANSMLAGKRLAFDIELVKIEGGSGSDAAAAAAAGAAARGEDRGGTERD